VKFQEYHGEKGSICLVSYRLLGCHLKRIGGMHRPEKLVAVHREWD
jgi:hypothetical protein